MSKINEWYNNFEVIDELPTDTRIKSISSAKMKFKRYYPNTTYNRVFNDILGFRVICKFSSNLQKEISDDIQIVTITRPTAYGEYEPYQFVHSYDEFYAHAKNL